jgi:hypothetical protein
MEGWSLADLIFKAERVFAAIFKAVCSFFAPPAPRSLAETPKTGVALFGAEERMEESKHYPSGPPHPFELEEGELPDSYGRTRLVVLAVGPYRVHAYWEVRPDELAEARTRLGDRQHSARVVLRFHDTLAGRATEQGTARCFDVEVDLQSRNWFVDLWSADKTYYADIGLKGDGGQFVPLARSNLVRTPRAWPVSEVGEYFMSVEPGQQRGESVPPPAYVKPPRAGTAILQAVTPLASELADELKDTAASGVSKTADAAQTLERRGEPPEAAALGAYREELCVDLTEIAEREFVEGMSSSTVPSKSSKN